MTAVDGKLALGISAAAALAFLLSLIQALMNARKGTDHAVHVFLTRAIRQNDFRLFVKIPNLLNTAHIAALPLFLHWIFAHFRPAALGIAEKLLNPAFNALQVCIVGLMASYVAEQGGMGQNYVIVSTFLFALTPQFYHALSARNYGLSARVISLFLTSLFFLVSYGLSLAPASLWLWPALIILSCLIWGFSTFGAQSLTIISIFLTATTFNWIPLAGAIAGLALLILLYPRYATGYLYHTFRFIRSFAVELAPIYVLKRRPSIWRDLVWDIWVKVRISRITGLRYAYENSLVIALLLNPLLIIAIAANFIETDGGYSLASYAGNIALCGALAMLLTSFRATRFLGEPERYVEMVTPWVVLAGTALLWPKLGAGGLGMLALIMLALCVIQLVAAGVLSRHLRRKALDVDRATFAIQKLGNSEVRFCCNYEQYTKLFMHNDWKFAYYIAAGHDYCGMTISDAFSTFPILDRKACARIVETYRINICVLDRSFYETLFDEPPQNLRESEIIFETDILRVLSLAWSSEDDDAVRVTKPLVELAV